MERKKSSTRQQFRRRAGAYARSESHAWDRDLDLLLEHLDLRDSDRVLDVATGTGFTALVVRSRVVSVTGLDLTHDMLCEAVRLATAARSRSSTTLQAAKREIEWVEGDAEALPFCNSAFSVVTCRRAPHHFERLDRAIGEMVRVLGPQGRIGIIDQISPEEPDGMRLMEELETLRDSSHAHALSVGEWQAVFARHQISVTFLDIVESRLSFEQWMALADTESNRRQAIDDVLHSATSEALRLIGYAESPEPSFLKRWIVVVGRRR